MTNFIKLTRIAMGFAIDVLLIWALGNDIKDHYQKTQTQKKTAPESVENTDE